MEKSNYIKAFVISIGTFLSAKLGMLYVVIPFLLIAMVGDYVTGMLASRKEGTTNSKTGMWGIIKKLMYGVEVAVGMTVDWLIINVCSSIGINFPTVTFFGLLVAIWLIVNELISILENLTRLEAPMPPFLIKIVSTFKVAVEKSGDTLANTVENNIDKE
ncbi:MAG: phage holin family protein [Clostridium sp.]|nr:phage holin family protein [Clostridium sp.]